MRHARRFIVTLIASVIGFATWCVAAATVAYAQLPPDPVGGGNDYTPPQGPRVPVAESEFWKFVLVAAIAAVLTVAVVGLVASVRQTRPAQKSTILNA